jgi:hypothetical protein
MFSIQDTSVSRLTIIAVLNGYAVVSNDFYLVIYDAV